MKIILVALGRFNLSKPSDFPHIEKGIHDDNGLAEPVQLQTRTRTRLTERLKDQVVQQYESGATSRLVAEELGIGKATVLKILREREVAVRPWGGRY